MSESTIHFFKKRPEAGQLPEPEPETPRLEPSTCVEAETFALRVLDNSMEPEFKQNCIIVIDPTGRAKEGSYVLANKAGQQRDETATVDEADEALSPVVFRQLRKSADDTWRLHALNTDYENEPTAADLSDIIGVIVQRAGIRRRYHKHYS